jgi:hypothetical protein
MQHLKAALAQAQARALAAETRLERLQREVAAKAADAEAARRRASEEVNADSCAELPASPTHLAVALEDARAKLRDANARVEAAEARAAWQASEQEAALAKSTARCTELEEQLKAAKAAAQAALAVADRATTRRDTPVEQQSNSQVAVAAPGGGRLAALTAALETERRRAAQIESQLRKELEWAAAEVEAKVVHRQREVAAAAHAEISRLRSDLATLEEQLRQAQIAAPAVRTGDGSPLGDGDEFTMLRVKAESATAAAAEALARADAAEARAEAAEVAQAAAEGAHITDDGRDGGPAQEDSGCAEPSDMQAAPAEASSAVETAALPEAGEVSSGGCEECPPSVEPCPEVESPPAEEVKCAVDEAIEEPPQAAAAEEEAAPEEQSEEREPESVKPTTQIRKTKLR